MFVFAQYLLGDMDFAPSPFDFYMLERPLGVCSADFMKSYFNRFDASRGVWFVPVEEED